MSGLEEQTAAALRAAQTFSEISPVLDLIQRKEILAKILGQRLDSFLTIDKRRVQEHFQGFDDSKLSKILKRWNPPDLDIDEYLSIPFFIETKPTAGDKSGQISFVISDKIFSAPLSTKVQYTSMLRAYSAIARDLKTNPSGWTHGLCSLIAQDISYRSSLAACPDLEVETAIAALLSVRDKNLVWNAYPDDDSRFDKQAYISSLRAAIFAGGSGTSDEALNELLRSPEEYNASSQQDKALKAKQKEQDSNAVGFLPPISPAMRICLMILPSTEAELYSAADYVIDNVNHMTSRFVLLNACYDKLCSLIGQTKTGMNGDSATLLTAAAEGWLAEVGYDPSQLIQEFEKRREQVWQGLTAEFQKRQQTEKKLEDMAYDPSMLEWAFRFFYNYSLSIRKSQKEFKDKIKTENAAVSEEQVDKLFAEQTTPEMVLKWWRQDPYISKLLDIVGNPNIEVRPNRFGRTGVELDCCWNLRRKGTQDVEQVKIYIIDPASSGGGKPTPGVSPEAKVVVRKTLDNKPEVIQLKDIKPGFYIQSVDNLASEANMHEDWARIVNVQQTRPTLPWEIDSGYIAPLEIGRKQFVLVRAGDSSSWTWMLPWSLQADKSYLLGIGPEKSGDNSVDAIFSAASVKETGSLDKTNQLIIITLSHTEIESVRKSGTNVWGYFANARFVQADVFPAAEGVDGRAIIEMPSGQKSVDSLKKASGSNPSDKVNAFDYGNPNVFIDDVCDIKSKAVDYFVTFTYILPSGQTSSILVAEGQQLVVCDSAGDMIQRKRAYQLNTNHQFVCGFNPDGSPVRAKIESIKGQEGHLGAYILQLGQCPLVRINGILIPVKTKESQVSSGIDEESLVQMSPPIDVIRQSTSDYIDLSKGFVKRAKEVGPDSNVLPLMYNCQFEPRKFWRTELCDAESSHQERYVKVITAQATLICGHLQEIYATKSDWNKINAVQASILQTGDKIVWLCGKEAESRAGVKSGSIQLVSVEKVEEMHPTESTSQVTLRQFIAADTSLLRSDLRPNVFANGILVKIRVAEVGPQGEDLGERGPKRGKSKTPREPQQKKYRPDSSGVIRDIEMKTPLIQYLTEDVQEFGKNRAKLRTTFNTCMSKNLNSNMTRKQVMQNFLRQYFNSPPEINRLYERDAMEQSLHNYIEATDFLISTGDYRVLPAVVNGYVFLGTLVYEAEAKELGDALTRDWLCIASRTLNKPGGKHFYGSDQLFRVRAGLMLTRDILLYIRDKCTRDGFEPVTHVSFDAESFEDVLNSDFVKEQTLSRDICSDHQVNMYNFCRQLDLWTEKLSGIPQSTLSPGFAASQLFTDEAFRSGLGVQQRQESSE